MPGFGSLLAGRVIGYVQVFIGLLGLILTVYFGIRFIAWYIGNWDRLHQPHEDIGAYFRELWQMLRWALFGIAVYLFSLLWSLVTSLSILSEARREEGSDKSNAPPFLPSPK
ncbi:MAG: hypothetical protein HY298_16370 [Verrucomicrobia bacterium]|nr:hypothetical protein [Verrucomicrobiota bacterium]